MPTFLFIRKGQVVDELRGAQEGRLKALLQKHSGAESSAFSGVGQSISGSSVSGRATGSRGIFESLGWDGILPIVVGLGYLFYVFFLKE